MTGLYHYAREKPGAGPSTGHFTAAAGTARYGESVRRVRRADGTVGEVWFGGTRLVPEADAAAELETRYGS